MFVALIITLEIAYIMEASVFSLSVSVHPLLDQCLLHLHLTHTTDFSIYLPPPQLVIVLTLRSEHLHPENLSKGQ